MSTGLYYTTCSSSLETRVHPSKSCANGLKSMDGMGLVKKKGAKVSSTMDGFPPTAAPPVLPQ